MMQQLPAALAPMAAYRQFIVYVLVPSKKKAGKNDKFPIDYRTGKMPVKGEGGAHDPAIWTDFQTASDVARRSGPDYGVGFVFTPSDPFWFLDIDGCAILGPQGEHIGWSELACALVAALPGAAVEISSSGRGLHIFGTGRPPAHGCKNTPLGLEFYDTGRFVALTGIDAAGNVATDLSHLLPSLVAQFFPPNAGTDGKTAEWTDAPCEGWNGPLDDDELLGRAMRSISSRAAFGPAARFADLWEANAEVLATSYPPDPGSHSAYGESEADRALAQHLAFWTGKDCERIERLMRRSALAREKWDSHDSYMERTILSATAMQKDVLADKPVQAPGTTQANPDGGAPLAVDVTGSTYVSPAEQIVMFKGCVYVCDQHRVLTPGGLLMRPDQFRVMFGGYEFRMDHDNRRCVRDSWEAFSQSQAYRSPRADSSCFRPELPPAALVDYEGQKKANLWWPVETMRKDGDASPFYRHLAALLPDERDRMILLSYMAAVVQHKGHKFQWTPLIQGVEGNGKTLLSRCVAFAVGDRYSYYPKASQIAKQFNDWQYGTVFAAVEDIYVAESSAHVMEELKPMVTGERNEIEGKGEKKVSRELCFNLMLNSNYQDALRKHRNDRRFAMFYTAQQTAEDIIEWGMGGDYFPKLWAWLRAEGFAIVNELLHTYQIPAEFNPAVNCGGLAHRAPLTSSYEAAIAANLGSVEQEVLEAIEQGVSGFAGGWVSSMAFDRLLERLGKSGRVPLNKRRDLLLALGYDWHPALLQGRVNNVIAPDSGKPRLFIQQNHPARGLTNAADVARAYTAAQVPQMLVAT